MWLTYVCLNSFIPTETFASRVTTRAWRWLSNRQNARRLQRYSITVCPKILTSVRRSSSSTTIACLSTPRGVMWYGVSVAWIRGFRGIGRRYGGLPSRVSYEVCQGGQEPLAPVPEVPDPLGTSSSARLAAFSTGSGGGPSPKRAGAKCAASGWAPVAIRSATSRPQRQPLTLPTPL